ncbi:MAG: toxin-antitoxin system HicB family antitoxin [Chloroflexota bacterium]|nr:toxin-antitoxin system HicB family antitoxin [Chloroflexota bacterium]
MDIVELTIRLPGGVHRRLRRQAQEEKRSLNRIIVQAVEMLLQKDEVDYQLSEYDRTMLVLRESGMLEPMGTEWDKYISGEPLMTAGEIRAALRGIPPLSEDVIADRGER